MELPPSASVRQETISHHTRIGPDMVSSLPPPVSQSVAARLTRAAIFLVVTVNPGPGPLGAIRALCADLSSLLRGVGFRNLNGQLSCVMGFSSEGWDRLFGAPKPMDLHPFQEIRGVHTAVSTPGDILFHVRAASMDLCFELATHVMSRLTGAVSVADEVHGFKFFDDRDLIGFVDGTENPSGPAAEAATLVGDEDSAFAGGSYVIVQKYLHDLERWNKLAVEDQENIIGRHKLSDIEQRDSVKKPYAHNVLTSIEEKGEQLQIVRDNMPFGEVGKGVFGTYFIGYARSPQRIEKMLENMFIGNPPGTYDHLLDFSRAVTGGLFFVPTATFLDDVDPEAQLDADEPRAPETPQSNARSSDGSLGIGSLKEAGHE
jgi:putative iron-dependent peroxidase